jgi:hypothetical protein
MNSLSFFLFDTARATEENLVKASEINGNVLSIYECRREDILAKVAPYVFSFPHSKEFSNFILINGWGNSWGALGVSRSPLENLQKHFQKFLKVKTEDNQELYFRFYDPRVLKIFLPTCDKQQILEFFGPVDSFIVEGETKEEAIVFRQKNGELITERIPTSQIFGGAEEEKIPEEKTTSEEPADGVRKPRKFIF